MRLGGIITLDLSLTTGWTHGHVGDREPESGCWVLPPRDCALAWLALSNELHDFLRERRPDLAVVEAPLCGIRQTSARLLIGLAAHAETECLRANVPYGEADVNDVRQVMLGRRRFAKDEAKPAVARYCEARGWANRDHNENDAKVLWAYTIQRIRRQGMRSAA